MKKIKTIPQFDRPRERMEQKGAKALSDFELLTAIARPDPIIPIITSRR